MIIFLSGVFSVVNDCHLLCLYYPLYDSLISLPTVATEIPAVSLPTVATDPTLQSTTIATTSGSAGTSFHEGPQAFTVFDSLIDNCGFETRIDR